MLNINFIYKTYQYLKNNITKFNIFLKNSVVNFLFSSDFYTHNLIKCYAKFTIKKMN